MQEMAIYIYIYIYETIQYKGYDLDMWVMA